MNSWSPFPGLMVDSVCGSCTTDSCCLVMKTIRAYIRCHSARITEQNYRL